MRRLSYFAGWSLRAQPVWIIADVAHFELWTNFGVLLCTTASEFVAATVCQVPLMLGCVLIAAVRVRVTNPMLWETHCKKRFAKSAVVS
jgi:hypothetical protein